MNKIRNYFSEVALELKKCTWPWDPRESGFSKYKELIDSTVVVLVAMLLVGTFVAGFDLVLSWALEAAAAA
jgi:preprotein translocase subunit SecE